MEIGPCRRMQRRTYPFAFVILSPGSKIGHTPRKNPFAPMGAAATSRINAYRGWCRTPVLHQPFAAKKYDTTIYRKLQVFFQQIVKYFLKILHFAEIHYPGSFRHFLFGGIIFYRGILYTFLRKKQGSFHAYFAWHGAFSVVLELLGFLAKKCYLLERLEFPGRETACIRACLYFFLFNI